MTADMWDAAHRATDPYWSELTGNCGGCGEAKCHPDQSCPGVQYCLTCPHRRAQGITR